MDYTQSTPRLIVYGNAYCPQAQTLAEALAKHHIDHEWRDVTDGDPRYADELRALANGNLSVPTVILPDGTVLIESWPQAVLSKLKPRQANLIQRLLRR